MVVKKVKHTVDLEDYSDLTSVIFRASLELLKCVNRHKGDTVVIASEQVFIGVKAHLNSMVAGENVSKRLVHVAAGTAPSALQNRLRGIRGSNVLVVLDAKRFATFHPVVWKHADLLKVNSHIMAYKLKGKEWV